MSALAPPLVEHAERYSRLHWALIRANGKTPRDDQWEKTQPEEPGFAAGTWAHYGDRYNMGCVLGPSGLAIFEYDDENAYPTFLEMLGGELPATPICRTGSGKLHVYFADPGGLDKKSRDGLELRVGNHQCLVPPSIHPETGKPYAWLEGHEPWAVALLPLPDAIAAHFQAARNGKAADPVANTIPAGGRHQALLSLAGTMRRRGMGAAEIFAALKVTNSTRCKPPLTEVEIRALAEDVAERWEPAEPRISFEPEPREDAPDMDEVVATLAANGHVNEAPSTNSLTSRPSPDKVISRISLSSPIDEGWPTPVDSAALYGIAGDYVRLVEPHTEADPVAVLLQTLVLAGSAIGRRPYVPVEADRHHTNLAATLIGETAKARKGTSLGHAQRLAVAADPEWAERIVHGLSSGEGLIHAVRDPRYETVDGEEQLVDAGVTDKRLQVVEPEFVSVLKVASRDGSTLTAMLRQAWDSGDLRTLTRREPLAATGAHVSLIGHITVDELRRYLDATEAANGFGNRILWACVRRSKSLPEGGHVPDAELRQLAQRLTDALDFARRQDEVKRDLDARKLWAVEYERLAHGRPGLVGALLARAEAQVLRLALVYALLDESPQIRVDHLRAALALWDYCDRSVVHVFGDSTGNPDADQIIQALRRSSRGLTRTEISNLFGRHLSAPRIGRALLTLHERNLAYPETEETGGRPTERWYAYANKASEAKKASSA